MPGKRIPLGPWMPDLPTVVNQGGLTVAKNMLPKKGGYDPIQGLSTITGATALDTVPGGALAGVDASGAGFLYAGSRGVSADPGPQVDAQLYALRDAGMTDISRSAGYIIGPTERWAMTLFRNQIYASTQTIPLQVQTLGDPQPFSDVSKSAPRARHLAVVRNFLFAGNIYDTFGGTQPETVRWSGISDGNHWPEPGSDEAVSVQSDRQELPGGGWVQDVVGAAEIGVVFQEHAISRFDYSGAAIFRRTTVESGNGMLIPRSAVTFERQIFYIAEDGFRVFDLTSSQAIGKNRVSSTFLADLDANYFDRVDVVKDPDRTVIVIAYPGQGNTAGRPNKLIYWDYALDRFSHAEIETEGLIENATTTPASIDAPASPGDPDDVDDPTGEYSFDDRPSTFGTTRLGAFDTSYVPSDFAGSQLAGVIETGDVEVAPGKLFFVSGIRPLVDSRSPTASIAGRMRRDDEIEFGATNKMDRNGVIPFRADARYHRFRLDLPVGWSDAVGFDVEGRPTGAR